MIHLINIFKENSIGKHKLHFRPFFVLMCVPFQFPLRLKKERGRTHANKLEKTLQELLKVHGEGWTEELRADLPRSFQRHGDLVLLGENCFTLPLWKKIGIPLKTLELFLQC